MLKQKMHRLRISSQLKTPIYEISNFRQGTQRADETMDQFHTRLCTLAQKCDSHDTNFEIKLQLLVCNGTSSRLRTKTLRDPKYTLEDVLLHGRKTGVSSPQASGMEEAFQFLQIKDVSTRNLCNKCGFSFPHKGKPCPAKQAICSNCDVKDHLLKCAENQRKPAPPKKYHTRTLNRDQTPGKSHNKKELRKSHKASKISILPANESSSFSCLPNFE